MSPGYFLGMWSNKAFFPTCLLWYHRRYHSLESYLRLQVDEKKDSAGAQQHRYLDFGFKDKILPLTNKNQAVLSLCLSLSFACSVWTEFLLAEGKFCKGKLGKKKSRFSSVSTQILMKIYLKVSLLTRNSLPIIFTFWEFIQTSLLSWFSKVYTQSNSGVAPQRKEQVTKPASYFCSVSMCILIYSSNGIRMSKLNERVDYKTKYYITVFKSIKAFKSWPTSIVAKFVCWCDSGVFLSMLEGFVVQTMWKCGLK